MSFTSNSVVEIPCNTGRETPKTHKKKKILIRRALFGSETKSLPEKEPKAPKKPKRNKKMAQNPFFQQGLQGPPNIHNKQPVPVVMPDFQVLYDLEKVQEEPQADPHNPRKTRTWWQWATTWIRNLIRRNKSVADIAKENRSYYIQSESRCTQLEHRIANVEKFLEKYRIDLVPTDPMDIDPED